MTGDLRAGQLIYPAVSIEYDTPFDEYQFLKPHVTTGKRQDSVLRITLESPYTKTGVWSMIPYKENVLRPRGMVAFCKGVVPKRNQCVEVLRAKETVVVVRVPPVEIPKEDMLEGYQDPFDFSLWKAGMVTWLGRDVGREKASYCIRCEYFYKDKFNNHNVFACKKFRSDCLLGRTNWFFDLEIAERHRAEERAREVLGSRYGR